MKHPIRTYLLILAACLMAAGCQRPKHVKESDSLPPMYPDYADITIPYNIAPLNFLLRTKPQAVEVHIKGQTRELTIRDSYRVQFAQAAWASLLAAEKGNTITVRITAKENEGWVRYAPFHWQVAEDAIDPYLSYRLIEPGYEVWNAIQLRERHLESFSERVIADNNLTERSCMNCHTYGNQDPNLSFFHLRGPKGGTILNKDGELRKLKTGDRSAAVTYGNFHPSGRYGVFSSNVVIPAFHTYRSERLEVYDTESDMVVLEFDTGRMIPFPQDTAQEKPLRTFPVFSADGASVYYCEAPRVALPDSIHSLRYSLLRIGFDATAGAFAGQVDTLLSAALTGKSVCHPKTSPDGRYIMYTVADYGTFPIWHRETDLQLLNLATGEVDDLPAVNAECSDTYHSWSSNSRWFVFASKRDDGIYGKPYFSYIDKDGVSHKPFVLPQRDPAFYDYTLKSFNIPELSKGKLPFGAMDIERIYHE